MNKVKILIFPAGAENALEIYNSLKYNIHLDVYGLTGKSDHAKFVYPNDRYIEGNYYINDDNFINRINRLITNLGIDIIIPTHDTVALFFAKYRTKINAKIVVANYETALIAREKRLTYEKFRDKDFCPKIYDSFEKILDYPVFIKPNIGEGAKGVAVVNNYEEGEKSLSNGNDILICEYLPGKELTVDCFTNRKGELLFIGPRTRERVQMGISFHSETISVSDEIGEIAHEINNELSFRGPWFFQVKQDSRGRYKLLEVSTRQAGTMAVYRQLGINFALLGIFDVLNYDVAILKNNFTLELDRCLHNRYRLNFEYNTVYIDFDDTLIVHGKVNDLLVRYIYQCINNKKRVVLITKHSLSLEESFKKYRLHSNMFDEIIHINEKEEKADYINHKDAILIDNYFYERKDVKQKLGIPVFDVDAVEALVI